MQPLRAIWFGFLLAVATPALAQMPSGEYLDAPGATAAVILAHGRGQGPDGNVVAPLRRAIAQDAGLHTLSLQMPVLATQDFQAYAQTFPEAYKRLQAAIDYLSKEKGVQRVYLLGYSMGARMTSAFLASHEVPQVVGYIGVGALGNGSEPLDANGNLRNLKVPVLDLYADATPLDLSSAEKRKPLVGDRYRQVRLAGADHSFKGHEPVLAQTAVAWLKEHEAQR